MRMSLSNWDFFSKQWTQGKPVVIYLKVNNGHEYFITCSFGCVAGQVAVQDGMASQANQTSISKRAEAFLRKTGVRTTGKFLDAREAHEMYKRSRKQAESLIEKAKNLVSKGALPVVEWL